MDLQQTITNIINQNGGRERLADLIIMEWPEIYGKRYVEQVRYNMSKHTPRSNDYQNRKKRDFQRITQ